MIWNWKFQDEKVKIRKVKRTQRKSHIFTIVKMCEKVKIESTTWKIIVIMETNTFGACWEQLSTDLRRLASCFFLMEHCKTSISKNQWADVDDVTTINCRTGNQALSQMQQMYNNKHHTSAEWVGPMGLHHTARMNACILRTESPDF